MNEMHANPPIFVIIPAYNEERILGKTLDYILQQTYKVGNQLVLHPSRVIVVANHCIDNTVQVANKRGVTVIETEQKGLSHARNLGASYAIEKLDGHKGYLVFLDADIEVVDTGLLEKSLRKAEEGFSGAIAPLKNYGGNPIKDWIYDILTNAIMIKPLEIVPKGYLFVSADIYMNLRELYGVYREDLDTAEDLHCGRLLFKYPGTKGLGIVRITNKSYARRYLSLGYARSTLNVTKVWLNRTLGTHFKELQYWDLYPR
jgi:glycosyltransferase involved in cell wall biosynthesis